MRLSLTELIKFYHNRERKLPLKKDILKFGSFCYKESEVGYLECCNKHNSWSRAQFSVSLQENSQESCMVREGIS